jgi:hypothetical protein
VGFLFAVRHRYLCRDAPDWYLLPRDTCKRSDAHMDDQLRYPSERDRSHLFAHVVRFAVGLLGVLLG